MPSDAALLDHRQIRYQSTILGSSLHESASRAPAHREETMKASLKAGESIRREYPVDLERTIGFMGEAARVYATPMLVRDIELTCRELLLAHLDDGEDSVGTRVEIDHLAATLLGMTATIDAKIAAVDGRSVTFEVTGSDGVDTICRCRHQRFVVDVKTTEARLAAKARKAGLA